MLLREGVEGRALLEDAPELDVDALDVRLLRGAAGGAAGHPDPARERLRGVADGVGPAVLDRLRVGELRPVVPRAAANSLLNSFGPASSQSMSKMRDEGVCVMSGFQSPLEKEVLNILLKGTSPLILVLARRMWDERHIPTLFRKPLAEGRLLVVSPVSQSIRRVDARSAAQRNRYIRDHADSLFLGALDPDGSLTDLLPLPSHLYKCEGAPPFRSPMSRETCRARREFGIICVK